MLGRETSAGELREWLVDGDELAVLDAREQGVYFLSHLFHAASVPLSSLELMLGRLVPRPDTRVVWCDADGADDGLAAKALATSTEMGWSNGSVLAGGIAAWEASGGELYSGVNVPSKAFGEHVEHTYDTPRIPAKELQALLDSEQDLVILDSRPMGEFRRMSIPTGTDCPGAELVYRIKEMAPDPRTLVVVNCAGRTRSIIGSQSLINAGLENRVLALENGTMGWELAGLTLDHGQEIHAPDPSGESSAWARRAAARVGERFGVQTIDRDEGARWQADSARTTYLFDVRTPQEFTAGHLPGARSAPGGQLVQATDEYAATRNARLVLVDDDQVRATMTASWLRQLGWSEAVVLAGGLDAAVADGTALVSGPEQRVSVGPVPTIKVSALAERLAAGDAADQICVLDLGSSVKYRNKGHIPGAWWGVRSRLDRARSAIGPLSDSATLVLTDTDGQVAKLAVAEAAALWPGVEVVGLAGGNKGWRHGGQEMEPGFSRPTTDPDDVWYKPYDHDDGSGAKHDGTKHVARKHMEEYLTWEVALVDQIKRDPTVNFPTFA